MCLVVDSVSRAPQPGRLCAEKYFIIVVFAIRITALCLDSHELCPCYYTILVLALV